MNFASLLVAAPFIAAITAASFLIAPLPNADRIAATSPPAATPEAPQRALQAPVTVATTTTAGIASGDCQAFVALAAAVGWPAHQLGTLERVMRAESRCEPDAIGDLTRGGSYGLMQIHTPTWCRPSTYWPSGWLATHGVITGRNCGQLLNPAVNLYAALLIQQEGGWRQWATYQP